MGEPHCGWELFWKVMAKWIGPRSLLAILKE
jgi:hypothetical protein